MQRGPGADRNNVWLNFGEHFGIIVENARLAARIFLVERLGSFGDEVA